MAYDPVRNRVVLFEGDYGLNETWEYDVATNTWTNVTTAVSPPPPVGSRPLLVYDSREDRMLLVGGYNSQVWSFDPSTATWSLRWQSQGENATHDLEFYSRESAAAYDRSADRVVVFGGGTWGGMNNCWGCGSNNTWLYDDGNVTWTRVNATTSPSERYGSAMTYDERRQRVVLFGGCADAYSQWDCILRNDTWEYDAANATWDELRPAMAPPPLSEMTYDSVSDRIFAFGGRGNGGRWSLGNGTWSYDAALNAWTNQTPAHSPPARYTTALVFASAANRTILFGGRGAGGPLTDTWAYEYGSVTQSPPSEPQNLRATPGWARVSLAWDPPSSSGHATIMGYRIYRDIPPANPTFLAEVSGGVLTYLDLGLASLQTYEYEVTAVNFLGEGPPSNRVTVTTPDSSRPVVAITSPSDNATLSDPHVTVTGTASDDAAVAEVRVIVIWENRTIIATVVAEGTTSWSANVSLELGWNWIVAVANDTSGNTGGDLVNVTLVDTTPPRITVPANITVAADGTAGAFVNYTASADDLVDGSVTVTCSPASGSAFQVGTTIVTCTATDSSGNSATDTFAVTVNASPGGAAPSLLAGVIAAAVVAGAAIAALVVWRIHGRRARRPS